MFDTLKEIFSLDFIYPSDISSQERVNRFLLFFSSVIFVSVSLVTISFIYSDLRYERDKKNLEVLIDNHIKLENERYSEQEKQREKNKEARLKREKRYELFMIDYKKLLEIEKRKNRLE